MTRELSPPFHTETPWRKGVITLRLLQSVTVEKAADAGLTPLCGSLRDGGGFAGQLGAPLQALRVPGVAPSPVALVLNPCFLKRVLCCLCFSHSTWICFSLRGQPRQSSGEILVTSESVDSVYVSKGCIDFLARGSPQQERDEPAPGSVVCPSRLVHRRSLCLVPPTSLEFFWCLDFSHCKWFAFSFALGGA